MIRRHLSTDELVEQVFPVQEGPAPVPLHLATCSDCQQRLASLRDGYRASREELDETVDRLGDDFWDRQSGEILKRVSREEMPTPSRILAFRTRTSAFVARRPVVTLGSLAAALALVSGLSLLNGSREPAGRAVQVRPAVTATAAAGGLEMAPADAADDELLRSVDLLLTSDGPLSNLLPETAK